MFDSIKPKISSEKAQSYNTSPQLSKKTNMDQNTNNENTPGMSPDVAVLMNDLDSSIPVLEKKFNKGKEHIFRSLAPNRMIEATVGYMRFKLQNGDNLLSFTSPEEYTKEVLDIQKKLIPGRQGFAIGSLRVTQFGHHAATIALIKEDQIALLVIDSVPDRSQAARHLQNIVKRYTPDILAKVIAKHSSSTSNISHLSGLGDISTMLSGMTGFEQDVAYAFKDTPNTSVYYVFTGAQSSITDCVSFMMTSLKEVMENPAEQAHYYNILDNRETHVNSENPEKDVPALMSTFKTKNQDGSVVNQHFILDGEKILAPAHYLHTQSREKLKHYCETSPMVNEQQAAYLLKFHDEHRQKIRPAFSFPRIHSKKANLSIRHEQIEMLKELRDFIYTRVMPQNVS